MKRANISTNSSRRKLLNSVLVMLAVRFASTDKKQGRNGKKTHGKILTSLLKQAVCNKQQLFCFMAWKRQELSV